MSEAYLKIVQEGVDGVTAVVSGSTLTAVASGSTSTAVTGDEKA